ncbi:NAD(P)H-dependent oxidoreductase [Paenibacillus sp. ACRRX]|uniref:NAD(P)H-dependent oxidoreductase n=1 Tax=unclassified Paenibacillus TaxID=185978 RepID=UPI001EF4F12B|nr:MULTISPECIES: NAD(P)H-dependent oxidoreductase [unclassified Paenibacillus]MCG7407551.1 NAD(P)H-dependent oxidoreductase [Paenibacillus sp. ACRRX]MDK8180786.1 NAD(P)H-dependent oxidoreductase [Paenibacillus sp. UMB4589-SE434]
MKYVVINTHPNTESFNYAIQETAVAALQDAGHEVQLRDLYTLNFNPVLSVEDFAGSKSGQLPDDIKAEQDLISWADVLVVIYPLWWASLPALLKGYIDRVFSYGFAYSMDGNGLNKLLVGKKAILFTTMGNTEAHYQETGMFDSLANTVDKGIFDFVGIEVLEHRYFTSVTTVDDAERKKMLDDVKTTLGKVGS